MFYNFCFVVVVVKISFIYKFVCIIQNVPFYLLLSLTAILFCFLGRCLFFWTFRIFSAIIWPKYICSSSSLLYFKKSIRPSMTIRSFICRFFRMKSHKFGSNYGEIVQFTSRFTSENSHQKFYWNFNRIFYVKYFCAHPTHNSAKVNPLYDNHNRKNHLTEIQ